MKSLAKQRGMGMLQWLLVLVIAGFLLLFVFKVVPIYNENIYVTTALKSIEDGGNRLNEMSDAEIRKKLSNFFLLNNVRSEGPNKNVKIDRSNDKVLVTIDYETRTNLMMNIDLVIAFQNHLDSTHTNLCCKPLDTVPAK